MIKTDQFYGQLWMIILSRIKGINMDNKSVIIIMYHYVRDLKNSRYPKIKGLDISEFNEQIKFLKNNYNFINSEDLVSAINNNYRLPENSLLLTFDDGYIDHYTNVFPVLMQNNVQGFFSIPGKIIAEHKLLDVNKLHFILACSETNQLIESIFSNLNYYRGKEFIIPSNDDLYNKLAIPSRFDDEKTIFIKRLLQVELDEKLRKIIVDELFKEYISLTEKAFCKELYMNHKQIKLMKNCGMTFGIHGYDHYWLGRLSEGEMRNDISKAIDVFDDIIDINNWILCYPYGSYNDKVLSYAKTIGCKAGFTTEVRIANIDSDDSMRLPRLDTNDFPPKSENYLSIT